MLRCICSSPEPFSILLDVKVISSIGDRHSRYRTVFPSPVSLYSDDAGVSLEKYCKSCRTAHLTVFSCCKAFVLDCVDPMVRIRSFLVDLSDEIEVGSLSEDILHIFWSLSQCCHRAENQSKDKKESFHNVIVNRFILSFRHQILAFCRKCDANL